MILSFKTHINGKPTFFVEKILQAFEEKEVTKAEKEMLLKAVSIGYLDPVKYNEVKPKIHTIREDKANRWEKDVMIDFFINARQKNMFRFAPRVPVISTQDIFMTRRGSLLEISIAKVGSYMGGDDIILNSFQQGLLAKNDGFDEYDDFRTYFINAIEENGKAKGNYWFSGKIIHWTDFKY